MNAMLQAELTALPNSNARENVLADPVFTRLLTTILWGEYLDLEPRLSKFNRESSVRIRIDLVAPNGDRATYEVRKGIKVPCFALADRYSQADPITHDKLIANGATNIPSFNTWVEYETRRLECTTRWAGIIKQVTEFVKAAKSINEAVKLWPDLRRYLDDETRERLDKKIERSATAASEAAALLSKLDTETINTSTVIARMSGAKV
jgi:hypothetical protein